jgi:hypothetical protein
MYFPLDFIPAIHAIFARRVKTARKIRAPREYMPAEHILSIKTREYMRPAHNLCARLINTLISNIHACKWDVYELSSARILTGINL